jgi:hypothetical protein
VITVVFLGKLADLAGAPSLQLSGPLDWAALKAALPYVTFSGQFQKRGKKDPFFKHSGLLTLDFDDIDPKQARRKVDQDPVAAPKGGKS